MLPVLVPQFCPTCGSLSFDGTPCIHPAHDQNGPPAVEDKVLTRFLDYALPVEESARNLRNIVRAEGIEAVRAQLAQLIEALTLDLLSSCAGTLTHAHVPAEAVRDAVRQHITSIVIRSGAAEA